MQLTKSAIREVRAALLKLSPDFESVLDELLPRTDSCFDVRLRANDKAELVLARGLWTCVRVDGQWLPSLRFLQRYPFLPRFQVDRGAVPHVLNGANIMAQGLLSAGGAMAEVGEGAAVLVFAEGKTHPFAVGIALKSSEEIRKAAKGIVVRTALVMGDELWDAAFVANRALAAKK